MTAGCRSRPTSPSGTASVAIANPTGAFVVTADDGVYHRLDLPGFDPTVYDDPEVRRTGMVGSGLSPDGTRLAYGFHGPLPEQTGQEHGFVTSGVRIVDLDTGAVETLLGDQPLPAEYMYYVNANDFQWATVPYGLRWSPDGRYLTYDQVWSVASTEGRADTLGQRDLAGCLPRRLRLLGPHGRRHSRRHRVLRAQPRLLPELGSTWPSTVGDSGVLVNAGLSFVFPSRGGARAVAATCRRRGVPLDRRSRRRAGQGVHGDRAAEQPAPGGGPAQRRRENGWTSTWSPCGPTSSGGSVRVTPWPR